MEVLYPDDGNLEISRDEETLMVHITATSIRDITTEVAIGEVIKEVFATVDYSSLRLVDIDVQSVIAISSNGVQQAMLAAYQEAKRGNEGTIVPILIRNAGRVVMEEIKSLNLHLLFTLDETTGSNDHHE